MNKYIICSFSNAYFKPVCVKKTMQRITLSMNSTFDTYDTTNPIYQFFVTFYLPQKAYIPLKYIIFGHAQH